MSSQEPSSVGEYLYEVRRAKEWSLRQAAERIGIAFSRLDEIEKMLDGRTRKPFTPSYLVLLKIAKAYGLPADDLLRRAGHEPGMELADDERELLHAYRTMAADRRGQLLQVVRTMLAETDDGPAT